jgi:hypothetical protein
MNDALVSTNGAEGLAMDARAQPRASFTRPNATVGRVRAPAIEATAALGQPTAPFVRVTASFVRRGCAVGLGNAAIVKPRAAVVRTTGTFGLPRAQVGWIGASSRYPLRTGGYRRPQSGFMGSACGCPAYTLRDPCSGLSSALHRCPPTLGGGPCPRRHRTHTAHECSHVVSAMTTATSPDGVAGGRRACPRAGHTEREVLMPIWSAASRRSAPGKMRRYSS